MSRQAAEWDSARELLLGQLNWQRTAAAQSVEFYPVPGVPLEPSVSFLGSQSPATTGQAVSPDNPATLTGVTGVSFTVRGEESDPAAPGYEGQTYGTALGGSWFGGVLDAASGDVTITHIVESVTSAVSATSYSVTWDFWVNTAETPAADAGSAFFYSTLFSSDSTDVEKMRIVSAAQPLRFAMRKERLDLGGSATVADATAAFNTWLETHPLQIAYKTSVPRIVHRQGLLVMPLPWTDRAAPKRHVCTTGQQSVQVLYAKSPARQAYELEQAIINAGG